MGHALESTIICHLGGEMDTETLTKVFVEALEQLGERPISIRSYGATSPVQIWLDRKRDEFYPKRWGLVYGLDCSTCVLFPPIGNWIQGPDIADPDFFVKIVAILDSW